MEAKLTKILKDSVLTGRNAHRSTPNPGTDDKEIAKGVMNNGKENRKYS